MRPVAVQTLVLASLALAALQLAACSRDKTVRCSNATAYREAGSIAQLRIPDDLSVPDETESLRIPAPLPAPEPGEDDADVCLDASPAFRQPEPRND